MGGTRCLVVECCSDGAGVLGRIASGEGVTDVVIGYLNDEREHLVFMLWGDTQKKGAFFDRQRHCVLTASHPAPLSADRRFFGCQHFSKANEYFRSRGLKEIE